MEKETYAVTTAADAAETGGVGKTVALVAAGAGGGFLLGAGAEYLRNREARRQDAAALSEAAASLKSANDRFDAAQAEYAARLAALEAAVAAAAAAE